MPKTGKRYEWEVGQASGIALSGLIQDFDWAGGARLVDLHVWRVGQQLYSCALSLVTPNPALTPERVREQLGIHEEIVHATIEIHYRPIGAAG